MSRRHWPAELAAPLVDVTSIKSPLSGGSQAHLTHASDGNFYVTKFAGNPQGTRTLINEWICHGILSRIGIPVPAMTLLRLSAGVLETQPIYFREPTGSRKVKPGIHIGSRYPGDPQQVQVFSYLPTRLMNLVENLEDFARILLFDIFVGNYDRRQVIFVRNKKSKSLVFKALFVDHGFAFSGAHWRIPQDHTSVMYFDSVVYRSIRQCGLIRETAAALQSFNEANFYELLRQTPSCWWNKQDYIDIRGVWKQLEASKRQAIVQWHVALHSNGHRLQCHGPLC